MIVDIKVKSAQTDSINWYMINVENMMMNIATENACATNLPHDKFYPGAYAHPLRSMQGGLHYYDQNTSAWIMLEDNVQRHFSDYMADKELLKDG